MSLVAFDFDGTLTDDEMIVRLAEKAGCATAVAAITERAMAGELSYAESLRERASFLSGLPASDAVAAYDEIELREGVPPPASRVDSSLASDGRSNVRASRSPPSSRTSYRSRTIRSPEPSPDRWSMRRRTTVSVGSRPA